jgi:hypothetical protein
MGMRARRGMMRAISGYADFSEPAPEARKSNIEVYKGI